MNAQSITWLENRNVYVRVKTYAVRPPMHTGAYGNGLPASDAIESMKFIVTGSYDVTKLGKEINFKPLQKPIITDDRWWDSSHSWIWNGSFSNEEDEKAAAHWPDWEPSLSDTVWRANVSGQYAGKVAIKPLLQEVTKDLDYGDCYNCYHQSYGGYVLTDANGTILQPGGSQDYYYLNNSYDNNGNLLFHNVSANNEDRFIEDILHLHPYVDIKIMLTGVNVGSSSATASALTHSLNDTFVITAIASRKLASPIELRGHFTFTMKTDSTNGLFADVPGGEKVGIFRSCPDDSFAGYLDAPITAGFGGDDSGAGTYANFCDSNFAAGHNIAYLYGGGARYPVIQAYVNLDGQYITGSYVNVPPFSTKMAVALSAFWGFKNKQNVMPIFLLNAEKFQVSSN